MGVLSAAGDGGDPRFVVLNACGATIMATTQAEHEDRVRDLVEALNDRDFDAAAAIYADDFTLTITGATGVREERDLEGVREHWERFSTAFPDWTAEVCEMAAEDEWVLVRIEVVGTHEGPYLGVEPTGNEVELHQHSSLRFEAGAIVEEHETASTLSLFRQLDVDLCIER